MLVLTRKINTNTRETVIYVTTPTGDVVKVELIQIRGKQVRIGFDAPDGYEIDRAEVYEANKALRAARKSNLITPPTA